MRIRPWSRQTEGWYLISDLVCSSLSVHEAETCCRRNQQRPAPKPVLVSAGSSCRADMSAHSSANIYRISGEDGETRKDCRWFEAESSEQTSWTQNQNCAVTTRLLLRLKAVCEALSCDHVTAAPCFSLSALRPVQTLASCSSLLWFTGRSQKQLLAEWREWDESWRRDAMRKQKNKLVS